MGDKRSFVGILVILISLLLTSCGPGQFLGPTVTPTNTVTPTLTNTPLPTITPTPTSTPTLPPTPTPTIEPSGQLLELFENPQITSIDPFDFYDTAVWGNIQTCSSVDNGELHFGCDEPATFGRDARTFHEGEGISIDFKIDKQISSYFSINFGNGQYGTDSWKCYGLSDEPQWGPRLGLAKGTGGSSTAVPQWVKPDVWYRYVLAVDQNGKMLLAIWERDKADAAPKKYVNTMGESWAGIDWSFWMNSVGSNSIYLDNYNEIAFSKIK